MKCGCLLLEGNTTLSPCATPVPCGLLCNQSEHAEMSDSENGRSQQRKSMPRMPNGMNHHAELRESIRRRMPRSTLRQPVKATGSFPRCQRCTTSRAVPILGRATPTCIHARRCQPSFDAPRQQAPTDPTPMQPLICFFPSATNASRLCSKRDQVSSCWSPDPLHFCCVSLRRLHRCTRP